jgi:3-isopropylmalate/(R)-2-methylmalate dehydratase large subunit
MTAASRRGQTIAQKIIARAAGRARVEPGEYIVVSPDYTCCQDISWPTRKRIMDEAGVTRLERPDKVILVVDHTTSAGMGSAYHKNHSEMRAFATKHGANFYGPGSGLRHQVLVEQGYARPGLLIFSDEPNIASIGAFGALNLAVSSEVVVTTVTDSNWMMVPRSARIILEGRLNAGVQIRDFAQILIRDHAQGDKLSQCCVEYAGPGLATIGLDERQTLLACTYHAGADTAIMPVDALALDYVTTRAAGRPLHVFESDVDADYIYEARYDLSTIEPMVTVPPEVHTVVPVSEVAGLRIDQAAIGTCANGRLEDMRIAARLLKGRKIASYVTMYITPGSREVYAKAASEGLLTIFAEAGAAVLAPGCTTCWGYEGVLNAGEVGLSTHQMNYHGRNGSRDARAYLSSPYVVAASALVGKVIDPRDVLHAAETVQ